MATVAKKQPAATKTAAAEKPLKGAGKAAAPAKQAAKQPAAPKAEKAEKAEGAGRGRKSAIDPATKLTLLVKDNPKREGSGGYERFQAASIDSKAKTVQADGIEWTAELRLPVNAAGETGFVNQIQQVAGVRSAVLVSYNGEYLG